MAEFKSKMSSKTGFGSYTQREMHKAVCAACKKDCQVPFKPIEGKPVYCRECYANRKEQ